MKAELYRKIFNALNEDLGMVLSDDDFEEPEIDLGVHMANINQKIIIDKLVKTFNEAINNKDIDLLKQTIHEWEQYKINAIYPVNNDNIKDIIKLVLWCGNLKPGVIDFMAILMKPPVINLNWINTSRVTDMSHLFEVFPNSVDISEWDVSNVTNMEYMFDNSSFDNDISKWDVSNVQNMRFMFAHHCPFNQDISGWNVSNVINMEGMFKENSHFDQPIGSWDVSNVKDFEEMFYKATYFTQDISGWKINKRALINDMFYYCDFLPEEYRPERCRRQWMMR